MTPRATLSIADATDPLWDVIVIGAGPAGATAARELARRGVATLLVERQSFPRAKVCGGCLNGRGLSIIETLGLKEVLSQASAAPVQQFVAQAENRRVTLDLPTGVAIDRASFDAALVESAIVAGAAFLPETMAVVEVDSPATTASRTVLLSHNGRENMRAQARIVLAADGLGRASVRNIEAFGRRVARQSRVGLGVSVTEVKEAYGSGTIYMAVGRSGYVGLVRTADGRLNVAAAVDPCALKATDNSTQLINEILCDAGMPALTSLNGRNCRGTLPLTRSSRRLAAARIFLLGDAAGYVEPFTGEGMGWAMSSAVSVVPYVIRLLQAWDERCAGAWESAQRRQLWSGQIACRVLAGMLRRPQAVSLALSVLTAMPSLASPIVRRVHMGRAPVKASLV